ncbi:DegT/DnrJ/EryC1/StrS family aminotransferase [Allosphingosinicella sp.]|jgi:dTDP-4-amino-4,6-dideoxygalactose transaminase|uniref:DegT/DnrJ/EryC1/StrS family aminotransferase n=1 Tax=Allosphingosinicella sp. TaxID=2823234 RepID=UPI002EE52BFF
MTVKFLDLQTQYQSIRQEIDSAVLGVLGTSQYVLGPEVEAFEKSFAEAHGAAHGVAVNTGTSALHVALLAAGIGEGDEVITVPMTFTATVAAISYTGATPVFVDVDPVSFTMDPSQIEARITGRTKAIMPVHLYGQAADMDPIMEIARRHGLVVIEDAAQAHLARYKGRPVGGLGDFAGFSFYPGKNLGAYGEGGLTTTNHDGHAHRMRLLRDWGQSKKYEHEFLAYNYRMDGIQGAILKVKLKYLDEWTERRRSRARLYQELLGNSGVRVASELPDRRHVYHIFSVFHPERDRLQAFLGERGIQTGIHYPNAVHLQKAYAGLGYREGEFPVTERTAAEQLSLPMYPELSDEDVERVADAVRAFT